MQGNSDIILGHFEQVLLFLSSKKNFTFKFDLSRLPHKYVSLLNFCKLIGLLHLNSD